MRRLSDVMRDMCDRITEILISIVVTRPSNDDYSFRVRFQGLRNSTHKQQKKSRIDIQVSYSFVIHNSNYRKVVQQDHLL